MRTRYLHAYTQTGYILALSVLETHGRLCVEGAFLGFPVGLLPVDCVVRVTYHVNDSCFVLCLI